MKFHSLCVQSPFAFRYLKALFKKKFFLLTCLWALENYLYLETEFQTNLKFKTGFFSPKVFQEKKMQAFPSKQQYISYKL